MADIKTTRKRNREKGATMQKAKRVLGNAGLDVTAAVAGAVAGAVIPMGLSGVCGVLAILAGNALKEKPDKPSTRATNTWLRVFGATLLASIPIQLISGGTPALRTDGTSSENPTAKEKASAVLKALATKFHLDKLMGRKGKGASSGGAGTDSSVAGLGSGAMDALDAVAREIEAGAMDYAAQNGGPAVSGVDFSMM